MSIRKLLIKFNNRAETTQSYTIQPENMRTRSGREYSIHSHELTTEEEPSTPELTLLPTPVPTRMPTPMPSSSRMLQPFVEELVEVIDLTVEPSIMRQPINQWKRRTIRLLNMCGGFVVTLVRSMPTILASIAGISAIMHITNPPEQRIEVNITTKWW